MLPAVNHGAAVNVSAPDPCPTPAVPAPIVVPYVNVGLAAMEDVTAPVVLVESLPATTLTTHVLQTNGDNPGIPPSTMGTGGHTGPPLPVIAMNAPMATVGTLTTGNNMKAPIGAVVATSVVGTLVAQAGPPLDLAALSRTLRPGVADPASVTASVVEGALVIRVSLFASHVAADVFALVDRHAPRTLVVDVRGCPGGDVAAALDLAEDFLPRGLEMVRIVAPDGEVDVRSSRREQLHCMALEVWVDAATASAAELFAGCLQRQGRARILGVRTHGKGTMQRVGVAEGGVQLAHTGEIWLSESRRLDGEGVTPDAPLDAG